jgi:transcriptional regulator with XRE-family HTH domain
MLVVETVARIRREFFVKGKSIKEIVRDLGVSRNTVRKVLRSGETAFAYERAVQPLPKLGPWASDLERLLEANDRKARRERLTMIRVFEELQGLGYRGGYGREWNDHLADDDPARQAYLNWLSGFFSGVSLAENINLFRNRDFWFAVQRMDELCSAFPDDQVCHSAQKVVAKLF